VFLLISCCPTGRNNTNAFLPFGIGYEQQNLRFGHTDDDVPIFAVILTIIKKFDGERVFEDCML